MTTLTIILPVFTIIMLGYIAGITGLIKRDGAKPLNHFVFYIALPALLFQSTATVPLKQLLNVPFIAVNLGGILASFLLAVMLSKFIFKRSLQSATLFGMNASYGTTGYMGIPLAIAAFGTEAALPATLATLIHNIPIITCVLLLNESKQVTVLNRHRSLFTLFKILKPVVISPITISVSVGITIAALNISLPTVITTLSDLLANASAATALFAIGLGLVGQFSTRNSMMVNLPEIATIILLKLLFQPLVTFILMIQFYNHDPLWMIVSLIMSALPVGAGVAVFAQKYEKMITQTFAAIFISMLLSAITISLMLIFISPIIFN